MSVIADTVEEEIIKLKCDDNAVFWGGSNETGKNNSEEALSDSYNFVEKRQKVNIVVMSVPHRYDLIPFLV